MLRFSMLTLSFVFAMLSTAFAQFEGVIEFEQHKSKVTKFAFFVKGDHVRIEEYDDKGEVVGVELVNLHTERVIAWGTDRKIYMDATSNVPLPAIQSDVSEEETTKQVQGYECTKTIVVDKGNGAKAEFWVTHGDFTFFNQLVKVLNRKDPLSLYSMEAQLGKGEFPIESTYYKPDGSVGTKMVTTSVTPMALKDSQFDIPKGYTKFQD